MPIQDLQKKYSEKREEAHRRERKIVTKKERHQEREGVERIKPTNKKK